MILSSHIEGDRYDTADFMSGGEYSKNYPVSSCDWGMYLKRVEEKLETMPKDGEINEARRKISDMCAQYRRRKNTFVTQSGSRTRGKAQKVAYILCHSAAFNTRPERQSNTREYRGRQHNS